MTQGQTMIEWRFGETPEDGEAWLRDPDQLFAYVEYRSTRASAPGWRRLMVVTKRWLDRHLAAVRESDAGPGWAAIPTMLVLPDANGEELRRIAETVIQQGGFDDYSSAV
jgi:hypothetical protein